MTFKPLLDNGGTLDRTIELSKSDSDSEIDEKEQETYYHQHEVNVRVEKIQHVAEETVKRTSDERQLGEAAAHFQQHQLSYTSPDKPQQKNAEQTTIAVPLLPDPISKDNDKTEDCINDPFAAIRAGNWKLRHVSDGIAAAELDVAKGRKAHDDKPILPAQPQDIVEPSSPQTVPSPGSWTAIIASAMAQRRQFIRGG
jgi:hypothetical protein